jgi:DNA-binding CsgD family transcriptional regulator
MRAPVTASERDLRALAAIVSEDRADLPDGEGLPPSLLADLMRQIRCDVISFERFDSGQQKTRFLQAIPVTDTDTSGWEDLDPVHWQLYWDCQPCSYPDRTGDLRSIVKIADFYSARQWHSNGMYCDIYRPQGFEQDLMLTLPAPPGLAPGTGRTLRLFFLRGPGTDFSERDRALLTLLRPHLYQAYLDAERRRHPAPRLTPRHWDLLHLVAAGHTNAQIARRLGLSEGTVRTHLEHIYARLQVSSRTAAVTRAFPDRVAHDARRLLGGSQKLGLIVQPRVQPRDRTTPGGRAPAQTEAPR